MGGEKKKGSKALYFSVLASEALFYYALKFIIFARHFMYSCLVTILCLGFIDEFRANVEEPSTLSLFLCVCEEKRQQRAKAFFDNRFSAASAASAASERRPPPQQSAALECRRREEEKWKGEDGQIYTRKDSLHPQRINSCQIYFVHLICMRERKVP